MSSDLLRRAAAKLREHAEAASPGPWRTHDTWLDWGGHTATVLRGAEGQPSIDGVAWLPTFADDPWDGKRNVWNDAEYIALMHPAVALALAEWLESEAALLGFLGGTAVAHAVLREDGGSR